MLMPFNLAATLHLLPGGKLRDRLLAFCVFWTQKTRKTRILNQSRTYVYTLAKVVISRLNAGYAMSLVCPFWGGISQLSQQVDHDVTKWPIETAPIFLVQPSRSDVWKPPKKEGAGASAQGTLSKSCCLAVLPALGLGQCLFKTPLCHVSCRHFM